MQSLNTPQESRPLASNKKLKRIGIALWIIQVLLALLFLLAGVMKLITPVEEMTKGTSLPGIFIQFIGVVEALGGLGLILPGLVRLYPILTPLAAAGLVIIMIGATATTLSAGPMILIPLITGVLTAFVAYGRWRVVPHRGSYFPFVPARQTAQ